MVGCDLILGLEAVERVPFFAKATKGMRSPLPSQGKGLVVAG